MGYLSGYIRNDIGFTHLSLYSVPKAQNFYKRCGFKDFERYMNRDEAVFTKDCIPMFLSLDSIM